MVIVSTNAHYLEEDYIKNQIPKSQLALYELRGENISTRTFPLEQQPKPSMVGANIPLPSCSGRNVSRPVRYTLLGEAFDRIPEEVNIEPVCYNEALQDKDADKWLVAMKSEMESIFFLGWEAGIHTYVVPTVHGLARGNFTATYKNEGNCVGMLNSVKDWLSQRFDMKDLGEAAHILRIKLMRDRKKRMIGLSQALFIDTILARFSMQDSKKGFLPFRHGITLSKDQLRSRCGIRLRFQSNPGRKHWTAVKHRMKYLKRTRDYMLVYQLGEFVPVGNIDSKFQRDKDSPKSTSGNVSWEWAVANSKEPRSHKMAKHIERKYHLIQDIVQSGDVVVAKIASENNLAYPFTKSLLLKTFNSHVEGIGVKIIYAWL
ncbi:uncharacterized protein LOC119370145 [Jatropha curcas]|uniref:uncharacterized protein LOC119370145 n=1 Tax=Jatropha curcas TaxID=180498 RepID=UPI001895AD69|nr:uncharacterized protein LOC119370145 [Jatropha curcas]